MAKVRIQKILGEAGVASRRMIEEMIIQGRIMVNDKLVLELPCFVDPDADRVTVDDNLIRTAVATARRYFLLSKPKDVVCSSSDELGRRCAVDCVPAVDGRLYCVGRLDSDSTGLIILTNDGELTQHITHPRHGVVKTYVAQIQGHLSEEKVEQFKKGVYLDGRRTSGAMIRVLKKAGGSSQLEIRLTEGRNREIRRILARLGNKVRRLHRSAIGPINDRGLKVGSWRELNKDEIEKLRRAGGFVSKADTEAADKPGKARTGKAPVKSKKTPDEPPAKKRAARRKPTVLRKTAEPGDAPAAKPTSSRARKPVGRKPPARSGGKRPGKPDPKNAVPTKPAAPKAASTKKAPKRPSTKTRPPAGNKRPGGATRTAKNAKRGPSRRGR